MLGADIYYITFNVWGIPSESLTRVMPSLKPLVLMYNGTSFFRCRSPSWQLSSAGILRFSMSYLLDLSPPTSLKWPLRLPSEAERPRQVHLITFLRSSDTSGSFIHFWSSCSPIPGYLKCYTNSPVHTPPLGR